MPPLSASPTLLRRWLLDRPYLLLVLTTLMWGGNAVASRMAVGEISPMVITWLRWTIACATLAIIAHRQIVADWRAVSPRWLYVILMGVIGFTAFNSLFYVAGHYTTAVNLAILQGSMPAMVLLGAFVAHGTRITSLQAVGLVITLLGIASIASGGDIHRLRQLTLNFGDVLMLIASIFYAGYTVAMRDRPKASPMGLFSYIAAAACFSAVPLMLWEIHAGQAVWPHTPKGWGVLFFIALCPSLTAQVLYIRAIEIVGPGRAGMFTNLVPVFGALLGVIILNESFGLHHALALVLVIAGILLAEYRRSPARAKADEEEAKPA